VGTVVLDTSVIIAVLDPGDALHSLAAGAVREAREAGHRFGVPTSVLAETLVLAARHGEAELDHRRAQLRRAFGAPEPLTENIAVAAARLRAQRASLRLPDAIVIATAQELDAAQALTADKRWRGVDPRIRVLE
jgi:predicted nucleic acid-binding protein